MLEQIMKKRGIEIRNEEGNIRNAIDVLEDMYLKLNTKEIRHIFFEMSEEERVANIFDNARGRKYEGVEK